MTIEPKTEAIVYGAATSLASITCTPISGRTRDDMANEDFPSGIEKIAQRVVQVLELGTDKGSNGKSFFLIARGGKQPHGKQGSRKVQQDPVPMLQLCEQRHHCHRKIPWTYGILLSHKVDLKEVLETEEKDSSPSASSSGTAEVIKHFCTL